VPGLLRHLSLVVDVKDDHNGKGKHHHHHGDEAKQHHCKGNSCNDDGNADGGEASTNANKDATPSTIPNTDVLWGDYKYVKP
jgi:hypothetical protein